ncbi:stage II sporulation protein E [Clostridia bacterium]|nr:stage II sporulation protein E [Clostridia bacterium]
MDKILKTAEYHIKRGFYITKADAGSVASAIFAFFLGRVVLLNFLNPVAMAFLCVFMFTGYKFYVVLLFILIGLFTKLSGAFFLKYALCGVFITVLNILFVNRTKGNDIVKFTACGVSVLAASLGFSALYGMSAYFFIMSILETVLSVTMAYILVRAVNNLDSKRQTALSPEDLISLSILFACVIAGSTDVYLGGFSFKYVCVSFLLMTLCYTNGSLYGCTAGVLLGFILMFTKNAALQEFAVIASVPLFAGLFRRFRKIGVILSFMLGGGLLILYFNKAMLTKEMLLSAALGAVAFTLLPSGFNFSVSTEQEYSGEDYVEKLKIITAQKLDASAAAFDALSKTIYTLSGTQESNTDYSYLMHDVAEIVCANCSKNVDCWEKNLNRTYKAVCAMLNDCERKSCISYKNISPEFKEACAKLNIFADKLVRVFELYKTNLVWRNKMAEYRELMALQLAGVSNIISGISEELSFDITFKTDMEIQILTALKKQGTEVYSVIVSQNKAGIFEVKIEHRNCGYKSKCFSDILPVVNNIVKRKMKRENSFCNVGTGNCVLRLEEEQKLRITSAVSRAVKTGSGESGDSHSFMELKNGKCLLVLSDGMGSGLEARAESSAVVDLLEELIESGFDNELAVKIINSVIVLKNNDESFSTLDICSLNLHSGLAEFIKIGAASTFVIRGNEVTTVRAGSLPIGILNTVDFESSSKKLRDNDIILMMTDGIQDVFGNEMLDYLKKLKYVNPQDISDSILEEAKLRSGGDLKDDMTVLAARIWERI